nr:ElyC/SanA/YdcF family protein [Tessaracoccus coleopterorum]
MTGSLPVIASAIHLGAVSAGRTYAVADVPRRGVAMVLGAKANPGSPSAFLAARLDLAVELFEAGKVSAVLVTGDGLSRSNHETAVMRDYLVAAGVPAGRIVEDPAGFDTYDSCVRARDVFGVTELTLVTQDYHVGRAVAICGLVGVDAVGVGDETMLRRYPSTGSRAPAASGSPT